MLFKTKRFQLSTNIIRNKKNKQNNNITADKVEDANRDRIKIIWSLVSFTHSIYHIKKVLKFITFYIILVFNHV